ncbi:MAG: 50S ribosomal protein L11 methyltransferase [Acidobacteriota bacterium]|nr:50S ribosomal protein L11 methyltransferase [Acidobacteriota bacterium]
MTKPTEQNWFALEITVDVNASEAIEFALNQLDAPGTEINNLGKDKPKETLCVAGYFNEKPDDEILQRELSEALRIYGFSNDSIKKSEWKAVENKDWLAEWKKSWKPTETEKFIIAPVWYKLPAALDKIVVRIEPSMAFGTGTHETTRLCLKAIEENYSGESFLDVGTGTGILAVAAAKIKSAVRSPQSAVVKDLTYNSQLATRNSFLACDTDEDSIKIARENAEINRVEDIEFYVGSIDEKTPQFDFVCANLTADVIVPLLPLLVAKFGKTLLLSGILREQEDWVVGELSSKFNIQSSKLKIEIDGEWISILIENGKQKIEN